MNRNASVVWNILVTNSIRFSIALIGLGFVVSSAIAHSSSVLPSRFLPGDASVAATPAWKIYTNANTGLPGDYIYSMAIDARVSD